MIDYSQSGEQAIILDYFKHQVGVCLSLGENDGLNLSNVRALIELGWSACLVEPTETAFQKLENLYRDNHRVQCIKVAVGESNGTQTFFESGSHLKKGDTGLLSTLGFKYSG